MASKKPAAAKAVAAKAKPAPAPAVSADADVKTETGTTTSASLKRVWALPAALLMLIVASGGLWFAVRESSNAPQAATAAATDTASKPGAPAPAAKSPAASSTAAPAAKPSETAAVTAAAKPVSITGCLQQDGDGFVLKNTEGTDAPKSRSWKSGFLKRHSASIDLVDSANATHLMSHVGQRVSVTGPLVDREMHVQSLHRVAAACQ